MTTAAPTVAAVNNGSAAGIPPCFAEVIDLGFSFNVAPFVFENHWFEIPGIFVQLRSSSVGRWPEIRNSAPRLRASPTPISVRLSGPASQCSADARSIHIVMGRARGFFELPGG